MHAFNQRIECMLEVQFPEDYTKHMEFSVFAWSKVCVFGWRLTLEG